jgi:hypothetical protein
MQQAAVAAITTLEELLEELAVSEELAMEILQIKIEMPLQILVQAEEELEMLEILEMGLMEL